MSSSRGFPFGKQPVAVRVQATERLPVVRPPVPQVMATAPLVDFKPPARVLPFREPPAAATLPVPPPSPLAPSPPHRDEPWISFRSPAAIVILAFDVVLLVYLIATWGR